MLSAALSGVRVLELSRLLPGPYCTQLLADMGACVTKIEDNHGGDYLRYQQPLLADGNSALFHAVNRGKASITLDLKNDDDRTKLLGLCADADVLVETFRPGVMARLGLEPTMLCDRFPRLIVCSITGYGQTGARAGRAGHDLNYLAHAGVLAMTKRPAPLPVQVADIAGGALPAALQICAALLARQQSGRGGWLDISMTRGVQAMAATSFARLLAPQPERTIDPVVGSYPCYDVYPCLDGHLAVGALEPKFWFALCDAIDQPELKDRGFDDGGAGDEVREQLTACFMKHGRDHWRSLLATIDCCVDVVRTTEEAFVDDDLPALTARIGNHDARLVHTGLSSSPPSIGGPAQQL
jgi:alpha-methylacyl-CoA racemase